MSTNVEYRPWPRDPRYQAGSDGSIIGPRGWALSQYVRAKGYRTVCVSDVAVRVHRIICETFYGPCPDGHEVAHWDGDPGNNAASNLRWATSRENNGDKIRHGTAASSAGERNGRARLTAETVRLLRREHGETGETAWSLAKRHGVDPRTVRDVLSRRTWRHVS